MSADDPLIRVLQTADSAAASPKSRADLVDRVHQRQKARIVRARRIKFGAAAAATTAMLVVALSRPWQPSAPSGANDPAADVNRLVLEAQSLKSEADVLEKWIAARQRAERLQELHIEHDRLIVAASASDPVIVAIDRTASNAICQADFLLETLGDRRAAVEAYRNVVEHFPDTHWAMVASDNLSRLEMN